MIEKFEKDSSTIYWGDGLDVLKNHIPDQSVNLIFVDPPYNIGKNFAGLKDKWASVQEYIFT